MKIVLLASMYLPYQGGGAERVAQTQAEALRTRGHDVRVITLAEPGSGVTHGLVDNVDVTYVGIRNSYYPGNANPSVVGRVVWHGRDFFNQAMARAAALQLTAIRPDIVVCHNIAGWSASVWPAIRSLGIPMVQVLHDQYLRCVRSTMFDDKRCETPCTSCRVMRLPHRSLSQIPQGVVGVSRYVLESHAKAGYFRDVPIQTWIHNVSHLDTRTRTVPARTGNGIVFGFMGGLTPLKGIDALLSSFVKCARADWRLRVAGTGSSEYTQWLRAAYDHPRIEFLGRQDPAHFYLGIDATIVPSQCEEALGNVVFESLIHGRPVLGARRGGIPEILEDGTTGLLYEPNHSGELEAAMSSFAMNLGLWRTRQSAIQAAASARFCDRDSWIARWEAVLRDALAARPGQAPLRG